MDGNDEEMPNAIHKLNHPSTQRMGDLSRIGYGNDYDGNMYDDDEKKIEKDTSDPPPQNKDGSINVRDLSLNDLRERLVIHFNIQFKQNKVKWPRRNKT